MKKELFVFKYLEHVGTIVQNEKGKISFEYSEDWSQNNSIKLSNSLPFTEDGSEEDIKNFLENLLPEGKRREFYAQMNKFSVNDTFEMLCLYGEDVAGQFSFIPKEKLYNKIELLKDVTEDLFSRISNQEKLDVLPDQRLSLAGGENKIAIAIIVNQSGIPHFFLPDRYTPSTHIIKASRATSTNEAFCMKLASTLSLKNISFPVAYSSLSSFNGEEAFVTCRYDRSSVRLSNNDGTTQLHTIRLHQEDFCQAMGRSSDEKYCTGYQKKGITNKDISDHLEKIIFQGGNSIKDQGFRKEILQEELKDEKTFFIAATAFSMCIGNSDDHAKNYSLLYFKERPQLAPLYDLVSVLGAKRLTREWADVDTHLSRPFGKEMDVLRIKRRDFDLFAEDLKMEPEAVFKIFRMVNEATLAALPEVTHAFMELCEKRHFSCSARTRIEKTAIGLNDIIEKRTLQINQIIEKAEMTVFKKNTMNM